MTEEFKKRILDYLCGKLEIGVGDNTPQYSNVFSSINNLYNELANEVGEDSIGGKYIPFNDTVQANNGLIIMWGSSTNSKYNNTYGWIAILDNKLNLLQLITKYDSGVVIGKLEALNVDENGQFYGIETAYGTTRKRFIMLNNIALKLTELDDYKLRIRRAYDIPDENNCSFSLIKKIIGQSVYILAGKNIANSVNNVMIVELKINIGVENEWINYVSTISGTTFSLQDIYCTRENNILNFLLVTSFIYGNVLFRKGNTDTISKVSTTFGEESSIIQSSSKICNYDKIMTGIVYDDTNRYYQIYQINLNYDETNNTLSVLSKNILRGLVGIAENVIDPSSVNIYSLDNELYYYLIKLTDATNSTYDLEIGRIVYNDEISEISDIYPKLIVNNRQLPKRSVFTFLSISKEFNLYNFYIQTQNDIYKVWQIYNKNNYNGLEYLNVNSMIPNSGIIYDTDSKPIFARNLYNKVIAGGTTQSTIEIPNYLLNDKIIGLSQLISQTNSILMSKTLGITKNIYETLYINFLSTINIKNENDPNNVITNTIGASKLNTSISDKGNYSVAKGTALGIYYEDNIIDFRQFNDSEIIQVSSGYKYDFNIYVSKKIKEIRILSNDEAPVSYQNITGNFEIGKFYKIKQYVKII
jgi:hypothetical protein